MLEVESMPVPGSKGTNVEKKNGSRKKWKVNQFNNQNCTQTETIVYTLAQKKKESTCIKYEKRGLK